MTRITYKLARSYVGGTRPRTLAEIADEIADDWDLIPDEAGEIVDSLKLADTVQDRVHEGTAGDLVRRFLKLCREWEGEAARRIKHELRRKLGIVSQ